MKLDRNRLVRGLAVALVAIFLVAGAAFAAGGIRTSRGVHVGTSQMPVVQTRSEESQASAAGQETNDGQGDAAGTPAVEQCGNKDGDVNDEANDVNDEATDGTNETAENNADEQCGDQGQQGATGDQGDQNGQEDTSGTTETSKASAANDGDHGSQSGSGNSGSGDSGSGDSGSGDSGSGPGSGDGSSDSGSDH
jgi:uncharacterized membrane protein YgcG